MKPLPLPNLLHPIPVVIQQLERTEAVSDDDYREPVQQAIHGPQIICPGQVAWTSTEFLEAGVLGADSRADGYILFRTVDLRAVGLAVLKQNDRFLKIGVGPNAIEVDLYVVNLRYSGHYADQGGASLVKAFFKDRSPSKNNPGGA